MATQLANRQASDRSINRVSARSATAAVIRAIAKVPKERVPRTATEGQHSTILSAFAELRDTYRLLFLLPDDATDPEELVLFERHDRAREVVAKTTAVTSREHAAKLRVALQRIDHDGQNALLLHGLTDLMEDASEPLNLQSNDFFRDMLWSTIADLERAEAAHSVDPHAAWLADRNALIARLNDKGTGLSDEDLDVGSAELNTIDNRILRRPATTRDGLLAKLLLPVLLMAEGHELAEEDACGIAKEASGLLGFEWSNPAER